MEHIPLAHRLCGCSVWICAAVAHKVNERLQMIGCDRFQLAVSYRVLLDTHDRRCIQQTETKISAMLEALPDILKSDGYPDVQVFMATYRKAEAVVDKYNRELAEWERKVKESRRPAEKERYAPPAKESVRDQLRRLQAEGRQQKTKHRSRDRER